MTTVILTAMVQVLTLGADPQDFNQACQHSLATRRPLVVLVGANWCRACQIMQKTVLPQVEKTGGLKNVVFVYVDFDQQRQLASRLTGGGSIPQLIRFDHTQAGWTNKRLIGAKDTDEVHSFINAGLINESRRPPKGALGASRQSTPTDGPALKKVEESSTQRGAKQNETAMVTRPQRGSHASVSERTVATAPAASQPWVVAPVHPPVGQQRVVEPYFLENPQKSPERTPFFKRLFQKRKNQYDKMTF
jgi:thiol-disulfide isomerase/thioredoxin